MNDHSFSKIIGEIASPDRLMTALIALVITMLFGLLTGPVGGNANPLVWAVGDKFLGGIGRKAYNPDRDPGSLAFRGAIFSLFLILFVSAIGAGLYMLKRKYGMYAYGFAEPLLLTFTLSGGAVWAALTRLYRALSEGKQLKQGSFYPIAVSTRTNLNSTDDYGITRVGLGFMAVNFDKGLIAPMFWYIIGGLPLAYLYSGIALARWALAKEGFSKGYGDFALWLERIFGFIPHVIACIILSAAGLFTPKAQMTRAMIGLFSFKNGAPYNEGGLVVTALAWALNVSLGGPVVDRDGSTLKKSWVGSKNASAKVDKSHLKQAIYMSIMAHVLLLSLLVAALLLVKTIMWSV